MPWSEAPPVAFDEVFGRTPVSDALSCMRKHRSLPGRRCSPGRLTHCIGHRDKGHGTQI